MYGWWLSQANKLLFPPQELLPTKKILPMNPDGSANTKYSYVAVIKDLTKEKPTMEVTPLNTSDYQAAQAKYKLMVEYDQEESQKIGFLTHACLYTFKDQRSRVAENTADIDQTNDVNALIAEYAQSKVDWYGSAEATEKAAKLITHKERLATLKEAFDKLHGLSKCTKDQLAYKDDFHIFKLSNGVTIAHVWHKALDNMHDAMTEMAEWTFTHIYKTDTEKKTTYLWSGKEHNLIYCSAGEFTKEECQVLIGFAMYHKKLIPTRDMLDISLSSSHIDSKYVGYLRERESKEVVRVNFTNQKAQSEQAFDAAWKSRKYSHGCLAHTTKNEYERAMT